MFVLGGAGRRDVCLYSRKGEASASHAGISRAGPARSRDVSRRAGRCLLSRRAMTCRPRPRGIARSAYDARGKFLSKSRMNQWPGEQRTGGARNRRVSNGYASTVPSWPRSRRAGAGRHGRSTATILSLRGRRPSHSQSPGGTEERPGFRVVCPPRGFNSIAVTRGSLRGIPASTSPPGDGSSSTISGPAACQKVLHQGAGPGQPPRRDYL